MNKLDDGSASPITGPYVIKYDWKDLCKPDDGDF